MISCLARYLATSIPRFAVYPRSQAKALAYIAQRLNNCCRTNGMLSYSSAVLARASATREARSIPEQVKCYATHTASTSRSALRSQPRVYTSAVSLCVQAAILRGISTYGPFWIPYARFRAATLPVAVCNAVIAHHEPHVWVYT